MQIIYSDHVVLQADSQAAPNSGTKRKAFNIFITETKGNSISAKAKPFKRQGCHNCGRPAHYSKNCTNATLDDSKPNPKTESK